MWWREREREREREAPGVEYVERSTLGRLTNHRSKGRASKVVQKHT